MIYPPPSAQAAYHRQKLNTRSRYEEVDIYTLDAPAFLELWIAIERSRGMSENDTTAKLKELGIDLAELSLAGARDHLSNIKSSLILTILAKDLAKSGNIQSSYYTTTRAGKQYIVFKGNHRLRTVLKGTRYLATNTTIMKFGIGGQALKSVAKSGFVISAIFSVSLHSIHWLFEENYRWSHWFTNLSVDVIKLALASISGYLAAKGSIAIAIAFTGTVPVLLPITAGLIVCVGVALVLDAYSFEKEIEELISLLEHYEKQIKNFDQTIADGVYFIIKKTGEAIRQSAKRVFFEKVRMLKRGLNPKWQL